MPGTAAGPRWRVECKNWEWNPEVVEEANRWSQGSLEVEEEGMRAPGVSPQLGEEVEEQQKGWEGRTSTRPWLIQELGQREAGEAEEMVAVEWRCYNLEGCCS